MRVTLTTHTQTNPDKTLSLFVPVAWGSQENTLRNIERKPPYSWWWWWSICNYSMWM